MPSNKLFTAKKNIPASEIDVESGRVLIQPPRDIQDPDDENSTIEKPAKIDFQIAGVKPIDVSTADWEKIKTILIKIAKKVPNLKDIVEIS